ncbi:hypothetical protein ACHHYP_06317 [Achlya hypogyna]|uniref:Uncharacterized protein n=1 Tax=Achlya hypogyna TaxID=1202772 RepID=A0A1V9YUX1_ACHHY|nr:hypothetical protein ACHHYP_06317 [Achlya hypogyna]
MTIKLYQLVLFGSPQFYSFPWKPLLNAAIGDSYSVARAHFTPHHATRANLALHFLCMVVQLTGNFCLLALLDATLSDGRPLSLATALLWSLHLLLGATTVPVSCNMSAVASILIAYATAPTLLEVPTVLTLVPVVAFCVVALAYGFLSSGTLTAAAAAQATGLLVFLHGFWWCLDAVERSVEDVYGWNVLFFTVLVALALLKNPAVPTVVFGSVIGRSVAVWTRQPLLFYYCYGYFGALMQGIAHRITKEQATLLALEQETSNDKVRYEFAHVTYFPTLVFESIFEAIQRPESKRS